MRIEGGLKHMDRHFESTVDQQFIVYGQQRHVTLPQAQRLPALDAWPDGAEPQSQLTAKVAALYAGGQLDNVDQP